MDPRHLPPEALLALVAAVVAIAIVQTLRLAWRSYRARRRLSLARERGAAGEARAEALLVQRGFDIEGRQVATRYGLGVDGEEMAVELRADYVVRRRGQRFVAEVKTGTFAPRIETRATRRQLLEYRVAFEVDGVLLVDADAGTVRRIEFPLERRRAGRAPSRLVWLSAGIVCGAMGALILRGL